MIVYTSLETGHENTIWMAWQENSHKNMNDMAKTWFSLSPYTHTLIKLIWLSEQLHILLSRKLSHLHIGIRLFQRKWVSDRKCFQLNIFKENLLFYDVWLRSWKCFKIHFPVFGLYKKHTQRGKGSKCGSKTKTHNNFWDFFKSHKK